MTDLTVKTLTDELNQGIINQERGAGWETACWHSALTTLSLVHTADRYEEKLDSVGPCTVIFILTDLIYTLQRESDTIASVSLTETAILKIEDLFHE